ncbi:SPFH domain-containing protein [Vallitalea okinawensis]|uniref:SPFH domain-containing protein n=1 Tax=Vallitalea okinawensis TaxID=2078660 RepID=UPI000CFB1AEA|nr:SPFH domain-containing protein [Vallitalea okinawensis]
MGLFDFVKNQLLDVIEWTDNSSNLMVYRFPTQNKEIQMGAQLTVRESQIAIFVNEGQIADVFTPGRYELTTANLPVLTKLKSWKYGFDSPFKSEVYFINTKQFTDEKWGTANPIMMRDADFGMLRLRAFGIYSFKVHDAAKFLKEVFGTNGTYDKDSITGQLKRSIVSGLTDLIAESKIPALDLAMMYDEFSEQALHKLQERFDLFGLKLISFYIENISLPEEVEAVLDKRTSMGVLGDMNKYAQYQTAEAIRDAAQNEGSNFANAGVGLGAGAAIGNMMGNALSQKQSAPSTNQQQVVQQTQSQASLMKKCENCQKDIPEGSKFCSFCGHKTRVENLCIKCQAPLAKGAKFCSECGAKQELTCSNCQAELAPGSKFCLECGTKVD